ncbi:hypothetical protein CDL15_Pgr021289 [Punica granatum]|uniref:Uncharacterized protein n=1 Tax=Punica granatum TaxID=22663 RepID=A0A218WR36_PUNGR|nr:hypothetical protein CDL15_Pgr021289 [Punica granatum]
MYLQTLDRHEGRLVHRIPTVCAAVLGTVQEEHAACMVEQVLWLLLPLFFTALIFGIQKSTEALVRSQPEYKPLRDPKTTVVEAIPACEEKFFIKRLCFDFVWSGSDSARIQKIVDSIGDNNPGRPIPNSKKYASVISFGVQINSTTVESLGDTNHPFFKFQIPFQAAAEREIARFLPVPVRHETGFAFTLSAFLSKSSSSTTLGSIAFIVSSMTQARTICIHGSAGVNLLTFASSTADAPGFSWKRMIQDKSSYRSLIELSDIYLWLAVEFFVWFILAIYLDNILPNASSSRKSVFYFLYPGYWTGSGESKMEESGIFSCFGSLPVPEQNTPDDKDVLEEETAAKAQASNRLTDPNIAVQICGLMKAYPGTKSISCCCCCGKRTVNFPKNQLFCLLGPNGAGNTTTISCLTGISPVTGGNALIYGNLIRSTVGMSNIRRIIGVCPQFDILWDQLTGQEHLEIFANIKGFPLHPSNRHVWDTIEEAKKGQAIVLTTHSIEEAYILSDRIGIMAKGRLRCIGTSIRLKSKFGTGFIANVSFSGDLAVSLANHEAMKRFFETVPTETKLLLLLLHLRVSPKEENKSFITFVIPQQQEALLTMFFKELEGRKEEFGISDIQIGLMTLREVFLDIAKQAKFETAAAEGRMETLNLSSGALFQIPVGARSEAIPGTQSSSPRGLMVEVYWEQDDYGSICIAGHSPETPIPPSVEVAPAGQGAPGHGVVLDTDQVLTATSR